MLACIIQHEGEIKTVILTVAQYSSSNPITIKSYKISQKLSPKHAARGVAQSPYPIYRHRKACLSKQQPWRAAGDPRLACSRSRVRALAPRGRTAHFFSPPSLPPSGDFHTFPTNPVKVLGLLNEKICLRAK